MALSFNSLSELLKQSASKYKDNELFGTKLADRSIVESAKRTEHCVLSLENDLLAPSLKLKRRNVLAKYGVKLESLY